MPRRSNLFQQVVTIIHQHMAGEATVEESAMLPHRVTGELREVDVVVRARVAGHEVLVAVEATAAGRRADARWVEGLVAKHNDLPASKLVLVSESGFTKQARRLADAKGAAAFAPEDLSDDEPAGKVLNGLRSIWPKTVTFTPQHSRLWVERPGQEQAWLKAPGDLMLFFENGEYLATLQEAVVELIRGNWARIIEMIGLVDIAEDMDRFFVLHAGPPWTFHFEGQPQSPCLRWDATQELHPIVGVEVTGRAVIRVSEVSLTHRRLGDVVYAYGEGEVGGQRALVVATGDEQGGKLTVRFPSDRAE